MTKCLNCGKEVLQTEGKRERKFCNKPANCRSNYWKKQNKDKPKKNTFKGTIEIPDAYLKVNRVAIITAEGKILDIQELQNMDIPEAEKEKLISQLKLGERAFTGVKANKSKLMSLDEIWEIATEGKAMETGETIEINQPISYDNTSTIEIGVTEYDGKEALLNQYDDELKKVPDVGAGRQRRKWLQMQIDRIKNNKS